MECVTRHSVEFSTVLGIDATIKDALIILIMEDEELNAFGILLKILGMICIYLILTTLINTEVETPL